MFILSLLVSLLYIPLLASENPRTPVSLEFVIYCQPNSADAFHSNMDLTKYYPYLPEQHQDDYQFPTPEIDHVAESMDLDESHTLMHGVISRLTRQRYPFIHKRWAVLLEADADNTWRVDSVIPCTESAENSNNPIMHYHIRGKVALHYKHYYDLTTDLSIEPVHADSKIDLIDHQSEYRRMKAKQLHYLDHSRIGILAKISPLPDVRSASAANLPTYTPQ